MNETMKTIDETIAADGWKRITHESIIDALELALLRIESIAECSGEDGEEVHNVASDALRALNSDRRNLKSSGRWASTLPNGVIILPALDNEDA